MFLALSAKVRIESISKKVDAGNNPGRGAVSEDSLSLYLSKASSGCRPCFLLLFIDPWTHIL